MPKSVDRIGCVYGYLTVVERVRTSNNCIGWNCVCVCGNKVTVITANLTSGNTKSCGCFRSMATRTRRVKHGYVGTKLYSTWKSMKRRCYNHNSTEFINYGGRGISVCDEWLNCFVTFKDWAYSCGYDDALTIDRINNSGNYEPSNCRWIMLAEQSRNTRRNVYLEYNGETLTVSEWSRKLGIKNKVLYDRIKRGWDVERTLSTPVKQFP